MEMEMNIALNIVKILAIVAMITMILTLRSLEKMRKWRIPMTIVPVAFALAVILDGVYTDDLFYQLFSIMCGSIVMFTAGNIYSILGDD